VVAEELADAGLELVDGSISGPPPWKPGTRIYVSGPRAEEVAALPLTGVDRIVVGTAIGSASAVKMSTASVYKGTSALLAHALVAARANGVLDHVLDDLRAGSPELVRHVERRLASAASKSGRYVGEMAEIAATQAAAGLTPALFRAMGEVYEALSASELGRSAPEDVPSDVSLEQVLEKLTQGQEDR
jgi:3-hydroxyisobutyrate dehydrogenase-like beta-hydroxyacid dehydrogenase